MRIIKPYTEIMTPLDGKAILSHIERCGRVCYKSEDSITEFSAESFIAKLIKRGHESVLEHFSFSVRFVCDRGVSHELVRHRIASFSQESTRYCDYSGEMTFIEPFFFEGESRDVWLKAMESCEAAYRMMTRDDAHSPQEARAVLPNSLKTEVIMTANLREWRHFFKLRTARASHPQMREIAVPLLEQLKTLIPVVFDDIAG